MIDEKDNEQDIEDSPPIYPPRRKFMINSSIMDKEMFYSLLANFDGDICMSGMKFSDAEREPPQSS